MDTSSQQAPLFLVIMSALVAVLLQIVVAPAITIQGVVPNFVLIITVILATQSSPLRATAAGFLLGLAFDLCGVNPLGIMSLVLTILAYAVSSLNRGMFTGALVADLIILVLMVVLGEFLVSVIYAVVGYNSEFLASLVQRVLPAIAYDALLGFLFLLLFRALTSGSRHKGGLKGGLRSGPGRSLSRKLKL